MRVMHPHNPHNGLCRCIITLSVWTNRFVQNECGSNLHSFMREYMHPHKRFLEHCLKILKSVNRGSITSVNCEKVSSSNGVYSTGTFGSNNQELLRSAPEGRSDHQAWQELQSSWSIRLRTGLCLIHNITYILRSNIDINNSQFFNIIVGISTCQLFKGH